MSTTQPDAAAPTEGGAPGERTPPTVGLLYPGFGAEDDFPDLVRRLGGSIRLELVHTSVGVDHHEVNALKDLGSTERLAVGARELMRSEPQSVIWACTSGSFVFGWDGAREQVAALEDVVRVPTSSTSIAFVAALRHLGLTRVAVAASYPRAVAEHFAEFLRRGGITMTKMTSHEIETAAGVGLLSPAQVVDLARSVDTTDAEAVLIPDTAMHTLAVIDELEHAVGLPVLTANQVSVWEGLRLQGAAGPLPNLGVLFR